MAFSEPNTILEINESHADNFLLVIPNLPTAAFLTTVFNEFTKIPGTKPTSGSNTDCDPLSQQQLRREKNLDLKNFMLSLKTVTVPNVSITKVELGTQFATISRASKINFSDLGTSFQVSENHLNYQVLLFWMYALHNPEEYNKISGREMINNFFTNIHLIITNNHREKVAEYTFLDAFPISLSPLNLSYANADKLNIDVSWAHSGMFPSNNFVLKYV